MKHFSLLTFLLFFSLQSLFAQTKAVTEYGDTIYVYNDGRWSFEEEIYEDDDVFELSYLDQELKVDTATLAFYRPEDATKKISSRLGVFDIFYNEKRWKRVPPGEYNDDAEFALLGIDKEIFCIIITEEMMMSNDALLKIALNNMKEYTGENPQIVTVESRKVNGTEVLRGKYRVNISGLDLTFDSYYFSSENGTIQFTTWTGTNIAKKYSTEIEDLLNGLVITNR